MKYDSIIGITTYSAGNFLKGCLNSILNTVSDLSRNVIVIANNSENDDYIAEVEALVQATRANVTTMHFRRNRGIAAALNTMARSYDAHHVVLFNDDILVWPGWYEVMNSTLTHPAIGVAGFMSYHGWAEWERRNTQSTEEAMQHITYQHLIYPGGSCMQFRQAVFDEIGGFDEEFWMGCEDVDFSMRAMELGYFNIQTGVVEDRYRFMSHYGSGTSREGANAAIELQQPDHTTVELLHGHIDHFAQKWGFPFPLTEEQQQQLRARRNQKAAERGFSL